DTHGHTRTATDILCVLTDTHGRRVYADGHPRTSCTDVLCVLTDSHEQPKTSCVCWQTPTDVMCVLNKQPTWAKITQTVHGKGQRAEPKPPKQSTGRASVLSPRTNVLICDTHRHTRTGTDVLCVLTDSHEQPQTSCVCWQTPTDVICVLNKQPTWAKITQTVHGKGQRADPCGPKSPKQSTGRASVLSPRTNVLICRRTSTDVLCVLTDTHRRPVCADGHTRTHTNSHRYVLSVLNRQPKWAKITQTVHGKG
ncbi:unnamed protein product, partial [Brassica rapa]